MSSDGSVTRWLQQLQAGDPRAAQPLWERYFHRLVRLARTRLRNAPRRLSDEEDVALSAFDSFFRNAERGCFPQLTDRDGLWRLLVVLTARKAAHLVRDETRRKRGGKDHSLAAAADQPSLEQLFSREPTPELAAEVAEEYERLLDCLGDAELRTIAVWKMEGHTVEEIAARLNYVGRSVKRKLQLIRTIWEKEVAW